MNVGLCQSPPPEHGWVKKGMGGRGKIGREKTRGKKKGQVTGWSGFEIIYSKGKQWRGYLTTVPTKRCGKKRKRLCEKKS